MPVVSGASRKDFLAYEQMSGNMARNLEGELVPAGKQFGGGLKAKTLRRMLKKAGLKTTGKKATLTKRCKKAHLMRGGGAAGQQMIASNWSGATVGGGRTRRRGLFRKFF